MAAVAPTRVRVVDAFTEEPFSGNPAAVVILDAMPEEVWMQAVAREMNLSETAFVIRQPAPDADYRLRWFTPLVEVDLCGHATLASGHCLVEDGANGPFRFTTRSGLLSVSQLEDGGLAMDFPAHPPVEVDLAASLGEAVGAEVVWTGLGGMFVLATMADEATVRALKPDLRKVAALEPKAAIVTAQADAGASYDFVSRVFGPKIGIDEDPVTGSSQSVLGPYWSERLGRASLRGRQVSARGGSLGVETLGDRVVISGRSVTVLDGTLLGAPVHA